MKALRSTIGLISVLFFLTSIANAQVRLDVYFGMGTARDSSTDQLVDLLGTGTPALTGSMGGVFGTLGGGVMFKPTLGAGAEVSFRFAQGDYAGTGLRPIFYDFNGIWTPAFGKTPIMPEFQAGFGGMSLRFYGGTQYYNYQTGTYSNFAGSTNHLQLHVGVGVRLYVKEHLFLRPQFDYHWVRNLTEFNRESVLAFSMAVGFSSSR